MAPAPENPTLQKRIRLAPAVRRQLILDAALVEFGAHGFSGASTGKIARRAGLSQAGLYAHFKSKDEILESLLQEILTPKSMAAAHGPISEPAALDALMNEIYTLATHPKVLALMRILIIEGPRIPHLIREWRRNFLRPQLMARQALIEKLMDADLVSRNPMTETYQLFWSPLTHVLITHLMLGDTEESREDLTVLRNAHLRMIRGSLPTGHDPAALPRPTSPQSASPRSGSPCRPAGD